MKILALNGSHRGARGFTQVLLERMKAGVEEGGAEFECIALAEKRISRCKGCEACHTAGNGFRCVFDGKDDAHAIFEAMRQADILIFATPIYVFAMSSLLKTLLERLNATANVNELRVSRAGLLFHHIDTRLCSKPFVLVVTCGNMEKATPKNTIDYFRAYSRFMDAPMLAALVRTGSFLLEEPDGPYLQKRNEVLGAYYEAGKDLACRRGVSAHHRKMANLEIFRMPMIARILLHIKPLGPKLVQKGMQRNVPRFD